MSAVLTPPPFLQFFNPNNSGSPAIGFQLFTYLAGTTTKTPTWTDSTQDAENANPLSLDGNGIGNVWLDPTVAYKFVWAPANDTDPPTSPIRTIDNIQGGGASAFTSLTIGAPASGPSLTVTSATGWQAAQLESTLQITGPNSLTNANQNVNETQLLLHGYAAEFVSINGSAGTDQKVWSFYADSSGNYNWRIENDALTATYSFLQVSRTGDSGTFGSHQPIITFNVGYGNVTIASTITAGVYELAVFGGNTAGFSNGLHIGAGTGALDNALTIVNAANTAEFVNVRGDGLIAVGPCTTANTPTFEVTGQASSTAAVAVFGGAASNFITVTDGAGMVLVAQAATGNAGVLGTSSNHPVQIMTDNTARVSIAANGNIEIASGLSLQLGSAFTSGAPSATGYVTVIDSGGTTRKLLCA